MTTTVEERPNISGIKREHSSEDIPKTTKLQKTESSKSGDSYKSKLNKESIPIIKGAWNAEEDELMKQAVAKYKTDWKKVSECIPGRTSKQCRDRYKLKLDPTINHGPWTPEEDEILISLQKQLGNQWTKIAKQMPGRTENSVKSRFASLERSRNREWTSEEDMILRSCRDQNLDFQAISDRYLNKRSEHAVRKRWEKLYMSDLAKQIRSKQQGANEGASPPASVANAGDIIANQMPQISSLASLTNNIFQPPNSSTTIGSTFDNPLQNNTTIGGNSFTSIFPPNTSATSYLNPTFNFIKDESNTLTADIILNKNFAMPDKKTASLRSGNLKKQTTSVTILQQILREPLNNL